MAIRASGKKNCLDCENYKRKIKENDHTVSARDVLIEMLQTELKKKEGLYRNAIDEHEKLRFVHCSVVQDYTNLKEIHKKLTEENKKLCEENQNLLVKLRETENSPKSSTELNDQTCELFDKKDISNIRNVADGISNIQNIMQSQNKSLRSMLVQLLDELKKSRLEHSPERDNQIAVNNDNSNLTNESLKKQIEDLNSYIEKLQKENKKIKENLYEKQVSLKNCLTVLENNNSDIDNLSKHVEGLCRQRDEYSDQVTSLKNELASKENEISKLKSETEQIGVLENSNSKLNSDNSCLKSQIETYSLEYKKLKCEIDITLEDKTELENKVNEYQTQFEQIQAELQEKHKEFEDYKEDMLLTIDQLKTDLEAARVEQDSRGIQCMINRPALCNSSTQESPTMKNRTVQSLEDCLSVSYKNTQVDDLEITGCCKKPIEKEMIEVEIHKQELQTLDNEFLQYRCVMDYRIQSLEKDNNDLKENLSLLSNDHERNLKKIDEEYHKCKRELDSKVRALEEDNSILRNSLESEANSIKFELEKVKTENNIYVCHCKNKIDELELENAGLRDTLSDMTNESRDTLKKLEENYCICKHAFEVKIKQLEEENKHLRDTLDIVSTDDSKSIEEDFNTLKTVLENKIRSLEKENNYLKEIINSTTQDYEAKLTKKEYEKRELADNLLNETTRNQAIIQNLIDEQNQYLQTLIHQIPNNDQNAISMEESFDLKTVLELKIKQLIDNILKLEENLATVSSENMSHLSTIEELSKSTNNQIPANQQFTVLTCLLDQVDQVNQTDETKGLANENNELKEDFNEMQRKVLTLEMELENANLELTEYEEENRSYSQRLQILMNEISCLQETKLHAEADINDYNLRLIRLQEEFSVLSRDRDQTITELNYKITELECKLVDFDSNVTKLKESQKENEKLQNKLDHSEIMLNNIRNELDSENNKLKSLEMLVDEKDEQLMEYCNQLDVVQDQLKDSKHKCQEYENKIQELESNKRLLEEKIAEYEKSKKETYSETDRLRKLISDLEEERNNIKNNNLKKTEENNKEISQQLSSLQEKIRSLQEQLKKKKTIIRTLEECIDKSNIVLQHCEKEMKIVQKDNELLKNELENIMKAENSFLKEKSDLLEENQRLKEQLNKSPNRFINKEHLNLKIENHRLLKESQLKDKDLKNLKHQLMQLSAQTKKTTAAQKSVSFAANTKIFDPKTRQSKQRCSKSNDSDPNTPKTKKEVRHDVKKKLTPTSPQARSANQKVRDSTRSSPTSSARAATSGLKSESLPNTLKKGTLIKSKPKDVSVYLALSNPYQPEKGPGRIEKTRAVPGDEENVSRIYGGSSGVPKNGPDKDKAKRIKSTRNTGSNPSPTVMTLQFAGTSFDQDTPSIVSGQKFKSLQPEPIPGVNIQTAQEYSVNSADETSADSHSKFISSGVQQTDDFFDELRNTSLSYKAHSKVFDEDIDPRTIVVKSNYSLLSTAVEQTDEDEQPEEVELPEPIEQPEPTEQPERIERPEPRRQTARRASKSIGPGRMSTASAQILAMDFDEGPIDRRSTELSLGLDSDGTRSSISKNKQFQRYGTVPKYIRSEAEEKRKQRLDTQGKMMDLRTTYGKSTTPHRITPEYIDDVTSDYGKHRLSTRPRMMSSSQSKRASVSIREDPSNVKKSVLSAQPRAMMRSVRDHRSRVSTDGVESKRSREYIYDVDERQSYRSSPSHITGSYVDEVYSGNIPTIPVNETTIDRRRSYRSPPTHIRESYVDEVYSGNIPTISTGTFHIDSAGSEHRKTNTRTSFNLQKDEYRPVDRREISSGGMSFKPIHQDQHYDRESRLADFSSFVDTPPDRTYAFSRGTMMINAGTDPIKPIRLSRGVTATPNTSPNMSTDQNQQILFNKRIYVPIETRDAYIDSRSGATMDTGSDPLHRTKQKSVQINKTSCNCMSVIMKQYKTQDGRVQNAYAENVTRDATYDIVEVDRDCSCPNVSHTGCSFSFGSYWAQPDFHGDYSDESNSESSSLCEEVNIRFATKYNCERDDESFDVCDCGSSSSHVTC